MGWEDDMCAYVQASLDRDSNKKTGPSDEDIIESFKKCGPHPHALHLNVPLPLLTTQRLSFPGAPLKRLRDRSRLLT